MRMKVLLLAVALSLGGLVGPNETRAAQSGNSNDACGCDTVLAYGVFEESSTHGRTAARSAAEYFLETATFEQYKKSQSASAIVVYGSFGFDGSEDSASFAAKQAALKTHSTSSSSLDQQFDSLKRTASRDILDAWQSCKGMCSQSGVGATARVYRTSDPDAFELELQVSAPTDVKLEFASSTVENAKVNTPYPNAGPGQLFPPNTVISSTTKFMLQRADSTKPVYVGMTLNRKGNGDLVRGIALSAAVPANPVSTVTSEAHLTYVIAPAGTGGNGVDWTFDADGNGGPNGTRERFRPPQWDGSLGRLVGVSVVTSPALLAPNDPAQWGWVEVRPEPDVNRFDFGAALKPNAPSRIAVDVKVTYHPYVLPLAP